VHDKTGLDDFARGLCSLGFTILSTGGTARRLREWGIEAVEISDYVGLSDSLGGRVKTLHPKIHAGILASRKNEAHRLEMERNAWNYIDIVAVNLYPLPGGDVTRVGPFLESMDIGGHALLRAAVKNCREVVVVCNPARYSLVLGELGGRGEGISEGLRIRLAREAMETAAAYDSAFHRRLAAFTSPPPGAMPAELEFDFNKLYDLRYGENPQQRAAIYRDMSCGEPSVVTGSLLQGKVLSYNNYLDLDAALDIVKEFQTPACAIIKHANPCGVAVADGARLAFQRARATDPQSSFGGIVALNTAVDADAAAEIASSFFECVIAPSFTGEAVRALSSKKNLRLLELPSLGDWLGRGALREGWYEIRSIAGGALAQDRDISSIGLGDLKHVTKARPSAVEAGAVFFSWTVVKHVRSNAVVIATAEETVGIGAGQMSRVDAARIAVSKARKPLQGCVAASDGFFPFKDAVEVLAEAGVKTIVQPGGSKKDGEVIAACDELGVAMVFTGMRCFKH